MFKRATYHTFSPQLTHPIFISALKYHQSFNIPAEPSYGYNSWRQENWQCPGRPEDQGTFVGKLSTSAKPIIFQLVACALNG
jgi:hypothetical protein